MFKYGIILLICLNVINGKQLEYNNSQIMVKSGLRLIKLDGNYYTFGTDAKINFFDAIHTCRDLGMELLSIETYDENTAIDNYLLTELPSFQGFWTSGSNLGGAGSYVWLATGKPVGFTDWKEHQPDNSNNNEHCIQLNENRDNSPGRWNDLPCTESLYYICEVKCSDFWKN